VTTETTSEKYARVVEDLYDGTLDTTAWNRAILGIADMVQASGALLFAVDPSNREILRDENHRFDPSVLDNYRRCWVYQDCRLPHFMPAPVGHPVTEQMMPASAWRNTTILNEFLMPADVPHFMPVWLHKSPTKFVTLSLQGSRKRGAFEAHDLEAFRQVLPHVSRALEIRDRLERAKIDRVSVPAALEAVRFGVIVLDSTGKVLEANHLAQVTLGSCAHGIRRKRDGTLSLRDPAGTQLHRWISTGTPPRQGTDGLLHVPREDAAPLSVLVAPLPKPQTVWIGADPGWLLLIFDPEMRTAADAQLIAKDLGISAREAELSALLFAGENLRAIARRFGVSQHTVRTQLKSIYKKTGIRSQSDLVRRIAFGPAVCTTMFSTKARSAEHKLT
jgi:DNA-binding CsgD family transcriptional regulator/PAS domain-containing protein